MLFELTCECGKVHHVSRSQAGQSISCDCGQIVKVPSLRGLTELPPAKEVPKPKRALRETSGTSKSTITLGILFAIIFLCVPTAIFFGYHRWNLDTSYTEQSDRDEANQRLDEAPPLAISEVWNSFSTTALGPPTKPDFYRLAQHARDLELKTGLAAGTAVLCGIAAAVIGARRKN